MLLNEPKKSIFWISRPTANKIPYVYNEDTAKRYRIPKLKSDIAKPGPYGITE